jgi:hypothetical protein
MAGGITLNTMSVLTILFIWLVVLVAAVVSGCVAGVMDRSNHNLSGVSYHAPLIPPQGESDLRILIFSQREPSIAD